jgi:hypothetical protein
MIVWELVTEDEFELPILIADSAVELAEKVGCSVNNIYSSVSHLKRKDIARSKFQRVEIEGGEE